MSVHPTPAPALEVRGIPRVGVRIAGTGHHVPEGRLTNDDLAKLMDTSDEWIVQRTGIRERRVCDASKGESTTWLSTEALRKAIKSARIDPEELDLVIVASVSGEMTCPATACRVAANVGAGGAAAFDLMAACSGFVYGSQVAHDMIRAGSHRAVAVVGCDVMSRIIDYGNRSTAILFGDSAGAAIFKATDDTTRGLIAATMHADGSRWHDLYLPRTLSDIPEGADPAPVKMGSLQMNGREVYKFAVGTFASLIEQTLQKAGVTPDQVDMYVCHQSNARMLESARDRFGIPHDKLYVNIDRFGNCSAGSVPVALDELRAMGKCAEGELVMFVAFGGGLTWAASLWRL